MNILPSISSSQRKDLMLSGESEPYGSSAGAPMSQRILSECLKFQHFELNNLQTWCGDAEQNCNKSGMEHGINPTNAASGKSAFVKFNDP